LNFAKEEVWFPVIVLVSFFARWCKILFLSSCLHTSTTISTPVSSPNKNAKEKN
jgi:hypothetical protein